MVTDSSATRLLDAARQYDRKGAFQEAAGGYEAAAVEAERLGHSPVLAEALRRLAVTRHRLHDAAAARRLAERSCAVAVEAADTALLAEGLNTLGGFYLVEEAFLQADAKFRQALEHAPGHSQLRGRIEQNLGTVRSSQGDHTAAMAHYQRSLAAFIAAGDEHSAAIAHHNLGVMSQERRRWIEAESHLRLALAAAERTGHTHLKGLVLLNRSEVLVALGRLTEACRAAEFAAGIFDELRASAELGDAYRVLGVILRERGQLKPARARLRLAAELAATSGSAIGEAEAQRDLAITCALAGELNEAAELLVTASRALARLKPCLLPEAVREGNYPAAVRAWGELMRVTDAAAAERAEKVGIGAAAVARELGHNAAAQARIRIAAYLKDVSPHLLQAAELPWGLDEIRSGHAGRQIIGLAEWYHQATTPAPAGRGLSSREAFRALDWVRGSWRPEIYAAFVRSHA